MPRRLRRVKHARARTVTLGMLEQLACGHCFVTDDGFGHNPDPEVMRPVWEEHGAQITSDLMGENAELRETPPAPTVPGYPPAPTVGGFPRADAGSGVAGIHRLRPFGWWLFESPERRNRYEETELEQLDRLDLMTDLERTLLHLEEGIKR